MRTKLDNEVGAADISREQETGTLSMLAHSRCYLGGRVVEAVHDKDSHLLGTSRRSEEDNNGSNKSDSPHPLPPFRPQRRERAEPVRRCANEMGLEGVDGDAVEDRSAEGRDHQRALLSRIDADGELQEMIVAVGNGTDLLPGPRWRRK